MAGTAILGQFAGAAFGRESTWGTAVSTTAAIKLLSIDEIARDIGRAMVPDFARHTDTWSVGHRFSDGVEMARAGFTFIPEYANATIMLLSQALGSPADSGAGPYTHTISMGDNLGVNFRGITAEFGRGRTSAGTTLYGHTGEGGRIDELEFSCAAGEEARAKAKMLFETIAATSSAIDFTGKWQSASAAPIRHSHLSTARVEILGTNYDSVCREVGFRIKNNLQPRPNLGSDTSSVFVPSMREVTFFATLEYCDDTSALVDAYKSGTQGDCSFTFASSPKSFAVDIKNCMLTTPPTVESKAGVQTITVEAMATNDHTNSPITITAINALAFYYSVG